MTTVVIQVGHYDRTTGSTGTTGEQAYNLAVAKATVAELKRRGVTAKWIDADEPGSRYTADYFVAIHADGSTSKQAEGSSVGYRNPRGKTLGQNIKAHYQAHARKAGYPIRFRADNYTTALGRYYGTGYALAANTRCRAVIVEGGFLTNPVERTFLNSSAGRTALALAIADAIKPAVESKPEPAQEEDDMPLTNKDADLVIDRLLARRLKDPTYPASPTLSAWIVHGHVKTSQALAAAHNAVAELGALRAAVASLATGGGLTGEQVEAAAAAGARAALAELGERLHDGPPDTDNQPGG